MPQWYPGQVAVGQKVFGDPVLMARGFASQPPAITTPGTVASGGTVTNSTGYDVIVYGATTSTITQVNINGGSIHAGSVASGTWYLPAGQTIAVTAGGTFAWTWLAA
jgi:hypothetical protein